MRLSIWRQFSSNHSAGFRVVGTFASVEDAQRAAGEIRRLLDGLRTWYDDPKHLRALEEAMLEYENPLIPIEKEFARKYGIDEEEWAFEGCGVDWVTDELDTMDDPLHVMDNHVFVSAPDITWQGSGPFGMLLEKMGGTVARGEADFSDIAVTISAAAPDEAAAARVGDVFKRYVSMPYGDPTGKELLHSIGDVPDFGSDAEKIEVAGRHLRMENAAVGTEWETMPRFVKALESMGFAEIRYEFVEQWRTKPAEEQRPDPAQKGYPPEKVFWEIMYVVAVTILFIPAQIYKAILFLRRGKQ